MIKSQPDGLGCFGKAKIFGYLKAGKSSGIFADFLLSNNLLRK
jgi:hypothetical protein